MGDWAGGAGAVPIVGHDPIGEARGTRWGGGSGRWGWHRDGGRGREVGDVAGAQGEQARGRARRKAEAR